MELSFWIPCGIGGADKSDKVITEGASKALPEQCKQKIRRLKTADSDRRKTYTILKIGFGA